MASGRAGLHVRWSTMLMSLLVGCSWSTPAPGIHDPLEELNRFEPGPALSPDQVVRIQMEALQHNDEADRGIEITFRFASPANQRVTGPLPRFARMMRNDKYRPMLNHQNARYGPLEISGDAAMLRVTIVDTTGRVVSYVFALRKETAPSCAGCWFTAAVTPDPVETRISA